nr:EamA family transporter [Azoarcus taiwanensis]
MNPASDRAEAGRGVAYGLAAYGIWGCFPLFFSLFEGIPSWEVLIHRIIWCCVFLVLLVSLLGRWQPVVD